MHFTFFHFLRTPADRLGKVVFANEVSIGGVGGGRLPRCTEIPILGGDKGGQLEFFRGSCATRQFGDGGVRFSLGPLKTEGIR